MYNIIYFKFVNPGLNVEEYWLMSISPEGIGSIGMLINFVLAISVSSLTKKPPKQVYEMVDMIRKPS